MKKKKKREGIINNNTGIIIMCLCIHQIGLHTPALFLLLFGLTVVMTDVERKKTTTTFQVVVQHMT